MSLLAPLTLAAQNTNPLPHYDTPTSAVVIHASRFEEPIENSLPQTLVISDQEIRKSGLNNVSEILQKVGGLTVKQNLDGSSNGSIDIRGFGDASDNNVVVLLDGIRLSENEQTSARTSLIPLEAIDHIEITRGGNSVLYGDGATGGTINIVTKTNLTDLTVATAGVGSYSTIQSSLFHAKKNGDVNLTFFGRQFNSSGYRNNSGIAERSAGFSGVKHISATDNIGIRITASKENDKLPGALPISYLNSNPKASQVPGYASTAQVDTSGITLFANFKLQPDIHFKVDFNHTTKSNDWSYNYDASTVYEGYTPNAVINGYSGPYTNTGQSPISWGRTASQSHTNEFNPRLQVSNFILPNGSLITGFDWREYKQSGSSYKTSSCSVSPDCYGEPNGLDGANSSRSFRSNGFYLRSIQPVRANDSLVVGARRQTYQQQANRHYYTDGVSNPSFYVYDLPFTNKGAANAYELQYNHAVSSQAKTYFRGSKNFRFANLDDNGQAPMAANNNLKPQTSNDYEIGFAIENIKSKTSIVLYESHLQNEIGFDGGSNVNYDPTQRRGIEISHRDNISSKILLTGSLNMGESKFSSGSHSGKTVPGTSSITGSIGAQYQLNAKERLGWQTRFSSSSYASGDMQNTQTERPSFDVSDISYTYSERQWQVIGTVGNVFNKNYTDSAIYKSAYYPLYKLTVYPNPGRNFGLTGRYNF